MQKKRQGASEMITKRYEPRCEKTGLRGYREADLRLCFRICKKPVFSRRGSYYS